MFAYAKSNCRILRWLRPAGLLIVVFSGFTGPAQAVDIVLLGVRSFAMDGVVVDDIEVQLAIREDASLPAPTYLTLVDSSATEVDARPIVVPETPGQPSPPPSFRIVFPNVLSGSGLADHGRRYRLVVEPASRRLAEPLPFYVFGCGGQYRLIQGLETDTEVVSQALNQALSNHLGTLEDLAIVHPELSCEIDRLNTELGIPAHLGIGGCHWYLVAPKSNRTQLNTFDLGGISFKGIESGTSLCYSARAEGGPGSMLKSIPINSCGPGSFGSTTVRLKTQIHCYDASGSFGVETCDGKLEYLSTLQAIAEANLHGSDPGAHACASAGLTLAVDGQEVAGVVARASETDARNGTEGESQTVTSSVSVLAGQHTKLVLETTGGAEMLPPANGMTFAEYGNYFLLEGIATSECTEEPERRIVFEALKFLEARQGFILEFVKGSDNGLKDDDW